MPVKIGMSSIEFSAIAQMAKDYEILYRALESIADMVDENSEKWVCNGVTLNEYFPRAMQKVANMALDDVTIKP